MASFATSASVMMRSWAEPFMTFVNACGTRLPNIWLGTLAAFPWRPYQFVQFAASEDWGRIKRVLDMGGPISCDT
jgi:hypothetical protein